MAEKAGGPHAKIDEFDDGIVMSFEPSEPKSAPPPAAPEPPKPETKDMVEYDEFGLPIRKRPVVRYDEDSDEVDESETQRGVKMSEEKVAETRSPDVVAPADMTTPPVPGSLAKKAKDQTEPGPALDPAPKDPELEQHSSATTAIPEATITTKATPKKAVRDSIMSLPDEEIRKNAVKMFSEDPKDPKMATRVSEWSHQQIVPQSAKDLQPKPEEKIEDSDDEWQTMPAYASTDLYDDNGRLIAVAEPNSDEEEAVNNMGGAAKGYTRVFDDEDADSVTSMDENTKYLFQEDENDDDARNPLSQMEATKELLTEGQRIAYVGVCRLALMEMLNDLEEIKVKGKSAKKVLGKVCDGMKMWSQKMMVRLYTHMEISPPEQIMIEQLTEHGVQPSDLTPTLRQNFRVLNPMAADSDASLPDKFKRMSTFSSAPSSPIEKPSRQSMSRWSTATPPKEEASETPDVKDPTEIMNDKTLNIDLRWTVLCDLFLVLIADSVYDARARTLLERVGKMLDVGWEDICKFEKRVTDALQMQESTEQNWSEKEHVVNRDKQARNKRFMMLGLATVGGGLVIGLSGGLLAPMIGVGLAAGFSTIGVAGTSAFLAGTGGTALIAGTAVASGSYIGGKAGLNRVKSVRTFEFKPLHNAKRMNLIITVSGWMNGKIDDVRLPYSTVDPIMGDLFSLFWEPEMLQSMGQTINILATEVLTQSLQQVLGNTILVALMASIQLPVVLTKLSYLLDNPWSVSLERAQAAGLILADTLIHRNLGVRPVTLVGYSLGARVIYYCLRELARVGAGGLVQNAYMFGTPVVVKKDEFSQAVSVVSGRFVNGYTTNDWILGYLFRATSGGIGRVAGLAKVTDIPGVENVDVTALVPGHMAYRQAMPKVLKHVGWEVIAEEFTEIEDPDPENHAARQRELINELEEARKLQEKHPPKKKFFGLFGRKEQKKKDWETYETAANAPDPSKPPTGAPDTTTPGDEKDKPYDTVLFDIDAIRAELAQSEKIKSEQDVLPVKEIEATMPSLQIPSSSLSSHTPTSPETLRQTKSFNDFSNSSTLHDNNNRSLSVANDTNNRPSSSSAGYSAFAFGGGLEAATAAGGYAYNYGFEDELDAGITMSFEPPSPTKRPVLEERWTEPVAAGAGAGWGTGRNVWAEEGEEFTDDGEVSMTFA